MSAISTSGILNPDQVARVDISFNRFPYTPIVINIPASTDDFPKIIKDVYSLDMDYYCMMYYYIAADTITLDIHSDRFMAVITPNPKVLNGMRYFYLSNGITVRWRLFRINPNVPLKVIDSINNREARVIVSVYDQFIDKLIAACTNSVFVTEFTVSGDVNKADGTISFSLNEQTLNDILFYTLIFEDVQIYKFLIDDVLYIILVCKDKKNIDQEKVFQRMVLTGGNVKVSDDTMKDLNDMIVASGVVNNKTDLADFVLNSLLPQIDMPCDDYLPTIDEEEEDCDDD